MPLEAKSKKIQLKDEVVHVKCEVRCLKGTLLRITVGSYQLGYGL